MPGCKPLLLPSSEMMHTMFPLSCLQAAYQQPSSCLPSKGSTCSFCRANQMTPAQAKHPYAHWTLEAMQKTRLQQLATKLVTAQPMDSHLASQQVPGA